MPKEGQPPEKTYQAAVKDYLTDLTQRLTMSFNTNLQHYNAVRPIIEKLETKNLAYRGALTEGVIAAFMNRYGAMQTIYKSPQTFYYAGISGMKWIRYFSMSPSLESDIRTAGTAAIYSMLWPPSLKGIAMATSTGVNLPNSSDALATQTQTRVRQQLNALVVSGAFSMVVSGLFKRASQQAEKEAWRKTFRYGLYGWRATGFLGIFYGCTLINQTMEESGVFGTQLKQLRDVFLAGKGGDEDS